MRLSRLSAVFSLFAFGPLLPQSAEAQIAVLAGFDCPSPIFFGESVLLVDSSTGDRNILSGVDPSGVGGDECPTVGSGTEITNASSLASDSNGDYLVADGDGQDTGRVLLVDADSGNRSVLSGCLATTDGFTCSGGFLGAGPILAFIGGVAVVSAEAVASNSALAGYEGDLIISGGIANCGGDTILRIDRDTGDRIPISGLDATCAALGSGDPFSDVESIALTDDGTLWVGDGDGVARLLRVDVATGNRTVVSGCTELDFFSCLGSVAGSGPPLSFVGGIVQPNPPLGPLLISGAIEIESGSCFGESILSVDPTSGNRTVISGEESDCTIVGSGTNFFDIGGLSLASDGSLITVDEDLARVLNVDPSTGARSVVTGCTDFPVSDTCDPPESVIGMGPEPTSIISPIEVVPEPVTLALQLVALATVTVLARCTRRDSF